MNAIVHHGELDDGTFFLPKPFTPASLAANVHEVVDHAASWTEKGSEVTLPIGQSVRDLRYDRQGGPVQSEDDRSPGRGEDFSLHTYHFVGPGMPGVVRSFVKTRNLDFHRP